jgi:hypothetical protein
VIRLAKRYARVNFQNRPSVATPVNDVNLNKLDKGIDDCDNAIEDLYDKKIDKTSISPTDTENSTTKVAAAAVAYALGQEIDEIRAKTPSDLSYIHSFYARKNDISGTTSTIRGDISYMISMKGILSGGFGFDSVNYTDKPSAVGNWGYIEFFKHADSFVTVKIYPETVENGIYICQFVLGGSDWEFAWKKITLI